MDLFLSGDVDVEKKKTTNSFLFGAAALSLGSLLVKILGVLYKIPLAGLLEDDGMSYFNAAYTVYAFFFILCSAGVPKAITIIISSRDMEEGSDRAVLLTSSVFFFVIGTLLSLIFIATAAPISSFIGNKKAFPSMLAISPAIPFIAASSVLRGYLNGRLKFTSVAISQCIEAAAKLVLGLALAAFAIKEGMRREVVSAYAIFGITIGSVITFVCLLIRIKTLNKGNNTGQSVKFSPKILKQICTTAAPITASAALASLVNVLDLAIIMRGLEGIGYTEYVSSILYGNYTTLAVPMFNFALAIITSICTSILPILTECATKGDGTSFTEHLGRAGSLVAFVAAPATAIFMILPSDVLTVLFEADSVSIGAFLLSLLSVSLLLIAALTLVNTALEVKGRYNTVLISMLVGSAIKLFSSYFLVGRSELALWGAPIGTALSYAVSLLISLTAYKKIHSGSAITRHFVAFGIISALSAIPILFIKKAPFFLEPHLISSLIILAIYGVIYLILTFLCGAFPAKSKVILA